MLEWRAASLWQAAAETARLECENTKRASDIRVGWLESGSAEYFEDSVESKGVHS